MSSLNILVVLLEDEKVVKDIVVYGGISGESTEKRFRMKCMLQKIMSSNTIHITDQTVR